MPLSSRTWLAPPLLIGVAFYGFFGRTLDITLLLILIFWKVTLSMLEHLNLNLRDLVKTMVIAQLLGYVTLQFLRSLWPRAETSTSQGPGRVLLFPSRTTHSRMFPKRHSFSYSYLVVGIPVGWQGRAGSMVSSGIERSQGALSWLSLKPNSRKSWFDIDAADYLERGNRELGLRGKLDAYLKSQVRVSQVNV